MSTYDNTASALFFSEEALLLAQDRTQHDLQFQHEKEFWVEELQNPYGPNIRYTMWKTKPCGQPDCHHPQYSPCPL